MKNTFTKITSTCIAIIAAMSALSFSAFAAQKDASVPPDDSATNYYEDLAEDWKNGKTSYEYDENAFDVWSADEDFNYDAGGDFFYE